MVHRIFYFINNSKMSILNLEKNDLNEKIKSPENSVSIVDFWAPWCGPCKMLAPIFETLSQEYEWKVTFIKVNVDNIPEEAIANNVQWIPTMIFFKDWKETQRVVGIKPDNELREIIDWII